ncbi:MAG: hypothetical protein COW08_07805, partial [Ignavibacteriales bacterium CG12_big_fil_rev_8_21_14_0_65_30_8]
MTKKIIFILIFSLLTGFSNGQTMLEKVQKKFYSIKDFTADFVQKSDGALNLSGKIKFKQKDKIRIEVG